MKEMLVGAVGIELSIKFTKSHVVKVLPTADRRNWSQLELILHDLRLKEICSQFGFPSSATKVAVQHPTWGDVSPTLPVPQAPRLSDLALSPIGATGDKRSLFARPLEQ